MELVVFFFILMAIVFAAAAILMVMASRERSHLQAERERLLARHAEVAALNAQYPNLQRPFVAGRTYAAAAGTQDDSTGMMIMETVLLSEALQSGMAPLPEAGITAVPDTAPDSFTGFGGGDSGGGGATSDWSAPDSSDGSGFDSGSSSSDYGGSDSSSGFDSGSSSDYSSSSDSGSY
jgi:hypothetical protein